MKKILILILSLSSFIASAQTGSFSFTLPTTCRTSAGVYKTDSTLVRTLWANKNYAAGTFSATWDGKDDYGNVIASPDATYDVRVLSNNVTYNWDGIIGNTSTLQTGSTVHKGYYTSMTGMAVTGNKAFFCQGYSEGYSSEAWFSTLAPQTRLDVFAGHVSTMNADYVATDGTNVYWAGFDRYVPTNSFVHVTRISDNAEISFGANGTAYTMQQIGAPKTYISVIDKLNAGNSKPTGLAVQQSGNYLFVAHGGLNQLHVLYKTTGALAQNLAYTSVAGLAVDGAYLWMVTGTSVSKYLVNANGTLSAAVLTLSGTGTPGAIQVYGPEIALIDETDQVVRFFNTSTGVQATPLGTIGGYYNSPDVTNTKFFFNDYRGNTNSFLAYAADGSLWVGDPGNYREMHYASDKSFIDNIMSMGVTYSTCVDPNDITRVFGNYLEFAVDYSQPLSGSTGWTLVKNWGYNSIANQTTRRLLNVVTLSNSRTYGYDYASGAGLVELTSTGLRIIGGSLGNNGVINTDGSLTNYTGSTTIGNSIRLKNYALTGFDGSGNPVWSSTGVLLAKTPPFPATIDDPSARPGIVSPSGNNFVTVHNKVILYQPGVFDSVNLYNPYLGHHLGAINLGDSVYTWKTQRANYRNYKGVFPGADYFEIGNGVNHFAGTNANVIDSFIFSGHHGEFWKNVQTNRYNQYLDDGLAIGQFGTDRAASPGNSAAGMAGNALSPLVVKDNSGNLYLYHGDESDHGGIHRWKISALNTISEQDTVISFPSAYTPPVYDYTDLHAGLPFDASLPNSAGWSKSGTITSNTAVKKYVNDGSPDVFTTFNQGTGSATVQRDLGTNNVSASWSIAGMLSFEGSDVIVGSGITSYVDVLDNAGKILARFNYTTVQPSKVTTIHANAGTMAAATGLSNVLLQYQPFEIKAVNGTITITYANYAPVSTSIFDPTGNWKRPTTLRQYFTGAAPAYGKNMGFMDMKFYTDYDSAANVPPVANAGTDQSITLPVNAVTLTGSGSDADGIIASYAWTQLSGPSSTIVSPAGATTSVSNMLTAGVYTYRLTVTDNAGATATDNVVVTVHPVIAPTRKVIPVSPDGGIFFHNNGYLVPGDTGCIASGTYPYISLDGVVGTASQPITIMNCGGQVISGDSATYGYRIVNSQFFHFTGTGTPGVQYGFMANWAGGMAGSGMNIKDSTSNYEVDHFEAKDCENGFLCKIDPYKCEPGTWSTGWTIRNISFHDNYVHKTGGEGFYIINTAINADVQDCDDSTSFITVETVMADTVKLYNNIVDSTGWDGIQVAASRHAELYNNRVTNYGLKNESSQQAGMILGGKSSGSVHDNYINGGTGEGLEVFGNGAIYVYNNIVANAGFDGTTARQDGIAIDDRPQPNNQYTGLRVLLINNTVVNAGRNAIHLYNSYGTMSNLNVIFNNLLVQPNNTSIYDDPFITLDGSVGADTTNNMRVPLLSGAYFVSPGSSDYRLLSNSPAIDQGVNAYTYGVTKDYDGQPRPQGSSYDAGAFEFTNTEVLPVVPRVKYFITRGRRYFTH